MLSSKRSKVIAAGMAAIVIGGGSYGIVTATSSSATATASSSSTRTSVNRQVRLTGKMGAMALAVASRNAANRTLAKMIRRLETVCHSRNTPMPAASRGS